MPLLLSTHHSSRRPPLSHLQSISLPFSRPSSLRGTPFAPLTRSWPFLPPQLPCRFCPFALLRKVLTQNMCVCVCVCCATADHTRCAPIRRSSCGRCVFAVRRADMPASAPRLYPRRLDADRADIWVKPQPRNCNNPFSGIIAKHGPNMFCSAGLGWSWCRTHLHNTSHGWRRQRTGAKGVRGRRAGTR